MKISLCLGDQQTFSIKPETEVEEEIIRFWLAEIESNGITVNKRKDGGVEFNFYKK